MDRKTLEQNYQNSIAKSAELEQNYRRGVGDLARSVKQATQYNPSAPSTQPAQAAPAGASSRKQSDTMKDQLDAIKKQRDDAAIKAGAYMRAGNMQQLAKEQQKIANKAAIEYENAYTRWKNQRNAEAVEDYNPDENKFKARDAALAGVQNAFQSMRQYAAAASSYLSGNPEAQAWEAKALMEKGVDATEAVKQAGLTDKREIPITDYKTQAELRHEKNVASVGAVEGGALQLVNTISNMVPSLVANAILPGSGLPMMSASAAGNKYADAYEKYGNTDMAFMLGSAAGGASMLTEQFGGLYGSLGKTAAGQAVAKKLMAEAPGLYSLANSVGGKWLRDALSEGIEEGAEDVINYAIEKAITGDSDEMDNFGYDILLGALAGGVLGGGNAAMRSITYNRVGKALNASPTAVAQQVQEGMEKGAGTAPAIYAAEVQKNPSNQMVGRLYEANLTYDAESGLSKIQNDITQVSIKEIKAMVSKADALAQAAQKLNVEATPQAVATAITDAQRTQSIKTAEDSVGQSFAAAIDNPANAGEKAYNSALAGVAANQGVAARINNDPVARQAFSQLTGVQFTGNTAQDIAAIEVATQNIAKSGKQAISQAEYAQRVTAAGEQAAAQFDADMQAQAEQMRQESQDRWLSVEQNTITDVDGKRHIKEITNTDVRGNTEIGYKKAGIPSSKKKAVAEVDNAAKYLGKTIVWYEGALQVNGQYRLSNGFRAPDGTIYVNINAQNPLMVTFGHEMFHDLVADGKYSGMIDTLVENPDYANMVKGMMNAKTELYERNGIELDQSAAAEEVAADISGDILNSRDMLEYIGARNAEAATGIKGFLNRILKKLKGKPSAQEAYNRLSEAQRALIDGMEGRVQDATAEANARYSIYESYADDISQWVRDGKPNGMVFVLGNTGPVLQGLGAIESDIYLTSDKLNVIQKDHPEVSDSAIKRIPQILEDPVLILRSKGHGKSGSNSRMVVIGAVKADNGQPLLTILDLRPYEKGFLVDDMQKVNSAYTKKNPENFIRGSEIVYADKNRTVPLLRRIGLTIASRELQQSGSIGRITYNGNGVNISGVPFSDIVPTDNYSMQNSAEDAGGEHSPMESAGVRVVGDGDVDVALPNGYEDIGVAITGEDSAAPNRYSLMSFGESDLGTDRFKYATKLAKATGVSVQQATDWIDSVYSVAAIIGDDKTRLDYEANRNNTSLKPNSEYDFSLDFSTLCAKRLLFSGTMDAIQSALPNTPLTSEDFVHLREIMKDSGYEVACGICYVESTRREFSTISEGFVEQYRKAQEDGTNIKKVNAAGQTKDLTTSKGVENNDPNRFVYPEEGFTPTLADLVTAEGIDRLQAEHPEVYKAFNAYMNARGQQKPKMIETRTDYRGEILNMTKGQVNRRNSHGGLRIQSFSDFEVPHLIDMMQAVYDMASMGLKGQAYTKVPAFARAMGQTGIKINLSLIAKGDGVDANGKLIFDDVEGMPSAEAFAIRNDPRFSDNVGTILVGKNVKHIVTAMADPEIDFIIPFHKSSWNASLYKALGLDGYEDFTDYQNEKKPGSKIENYDPSEYWDFSKSGDENAQIYLAKCKADGRTPKFTDVMYNGKSLTEYPGYWKLLIDFKMYNNDGIGAEQHPVKPVFDDAFDTGLLSEYNGGHRRLPVAQDIVERFLAEKETGSYSLMEDAQYMADIDKAVSEATAKADEALKAAQTEVKNLRQQLADYRQQATAEAKMNDRWREAETKLLADMAAAKEREKAAKARAEFMQKYDTLSKQYRADLRANSQQARAQYDEKLAEAKDEFNRRRTQDRIDRVVREDQAKSKARLRAAEQKSTTTEDVAKVLTEMPKKDKEAFKTKAAESWRTFKRQWINTKDELERFGNAVGDSRITYAANNVGQAAAAAQYSIGGAGQYDLNGKKISDKNLTQVFEPAKKAGLTEEFYTYLLHEHNVDRMSVREKAQQQLAELRAKLNKEVKGFAEMTDENISAAAGKDAALAKAYTKEQIAAAKQYKQFQAWAEKQFDKPVFGSSVTADDSRAAAADLLDAHPEFEKWAKDVYAYLDGLMEVRKQGGLVSEDMVQRMKELYPHYVPTYRDMPSTSGGYSNPNSVAVNSTIKSAKGGNQNIMPLIDSIARQTLQTFSAAKKNILGNMLYEDAMDTTRDVSEYIQNVTEDGDLVDLDADSAENLKNTLRIWVDGKPVTLHMSEAMADGFRPIEQSNSFGMKALRSVNSTFKKLVTQWNPVFIVRNFIRDAQSALYFTHYSYATFIKNYGKAVKEIATNGKYWQLYQAMGGKGTTYYDPKTGLADRYHFKNGAVDKIAGGWNRVIDILSFANEAVEQYPRLAEFISTMEATGDVQQALYNAADITTNFGRGGFAARKLNASLVPFFNPGMQGLSKNIRNVIDRRGWKEIGQLISRLLINGVAPGIIMGLLYDGLKEDDEYKELSDYIKDSNILIKVGDNKFIKIPMGREPSVITAFTNRMWRWLKGEPASSAFAGYPSFAIEQIAPNNPLTNNIFAGITAMSTNKTWYGGDIVSSYMEEKPDYLQYDESTDAFSIWLGEITRHGKNGIEGLSPKKVNYLIDQYSGFIGDWVLPALSKKADVPAVVKAFVVDSVRQNRLGSDFYDALDEAKQVKDTEMATAADDATYSYLYKQSKAASEITKQLKEIYNSGEKTRKEKLAEARDLLELRNEIYRNALLTVGTYEETAKGIDSADSDVVKREANRKAFGAEYALKNYNKDVGEKAAEYVAQGVTYDQYYAAYFATRGITGDKDENGKTITNSASRKKKEAIDKAVPNATTKQKHLLYEAIGVSEKVW